MSLLRPQISFFQVEQHGCCFIALMSYLHATFLVSLTILCKDKQQQTQNSYLFSLYYYYSP